MKKLILLPNLLSENSSASLYLPEELPEILRSLDGLFVETPKVARAFIKKFLTHEELVALPMVELNEHVSKEEVTEIFRQTSATETWGILSDAGLPCIADPGSHLVALAHKHHTILEALPGPCSVVMALQLSGFFSQKFAFWGYLPRKEEELQQTFQTLLKRTSEGPQIWIEAPYRTDKMVESVLKYVKGKYQFCVAVDLTSKEPVILTENIDRWKKRSFGKKPAVFILNR